MSRRAFLRRSAAALGLVAVGGVAACSGGDDDVLGSASSGSTTTATTARSAGTAEPDASASTTTETAPSQDTSAGSSAVVADGAELAVSFTYAAAAGGRIDNPYVAVWIEDPAGALVQALGVFYRAGRDARYLSELRQWSSTDGADAVLAAVSSATRTPGEYALLWDGTDLDGARVFQGDYVVNIEAAREHGPYSLVSQAVTLGTEASSTALAADGELSGATADFRP